jgi:hypothetical protein
MRLRTLATMAAFATLAACSSKAGDSTAADDPAPTMPDRSADPNAAAPATDPATDPAAPPPSLGAGTTTDADAGSDAGGGGSGTGGGGGAGTGGGGGGGASSQCQAGSVKEVESNDSAATANAMPAATGSFCGTLGDGDVDFVTFTLPADAKYLAFGSSWTNPIQMEVSVGGQKFDVGQTPAFVAGGQYVIKIHAASKADYRLELEIKK